MSRIVKVLTQTKLRGTIYYELREVVPIPFSGSRSFVGLMARVTVPN